MKNRHHQIPRARKRAKINKTIERTSAKVLDFVGVREGAGREEELFRGALLVVEGALPDTGVNWAGGIPTGAETGSPGVPVV
jgi:hypothetical protein